MKVLAFAASSSKQSINGALVKYATAKLANAQIEIIDINDYEMPIFSVDREAEVGQHELAKAFYKKIGEADALVIAFAEHNGSYTAAYKNLYDWTSRIDMKVFQGKPAVYLASSPGPGGANGVLSQALSSAPYFGADVVASLSVPKFFDVFDTASGKLIDDQLDAKLADIMAALSN